MLKELADPQKRIVGTKQVLRAIAQGEAECVFVAADADEPIRQRIISACDEQNIPAQQQHTLRELGAACRIAVGAAAVALKK